MILQDLLSELREGILNDRTDRVDGTSDYMWTDARLISYINEAQRRFAVQGLVIRDATTAEVVNVTLVSGQSEYLLHDSVLAVVSARRAELDYPVDMVRVGHSILNSYRPPNETVWDMASATSQNPGPPTAFSTDEGHGLDDCDRQSKIIMRVFPTPGADEAGNIVKLRVIRKPINTLAANCLGEEPEIPSDHHIEMLDWAAYLALRIVDDDAGNPMRADEFRASFENHVQNARRTAMRKLFAPTARGFGRHGWSWEH